MKITLSDTERICKDIYQKGFDLELLFSGNANSERIFGVDMKEFRQDKMTAFSRAVTRFNEDFFIPEDMDVHVLRQPRYMPVKDHCHDFIEFIYVYQGSCTQHINGAEVEAEEGDLFLLSPGIYHHIAAYDDDIIVLYVMIRVTTFATAFLSLLKQDDILSEFFAHVLYSGNKHPYLLFFTKGDKALKEWIYDMYLEAVGKDRYSDRMLNTQLEWMCLHLLRNHVINMELYGHKGKAVRIMEFLDYISENASGITLSSMARHFGYSASYLSRMIKDMTGRNFKDIVLRARLERACELLKNNSISVGAVAESVGFCDASNFHKAFKKQLQMTPSEYRKSL
ncbi:AraC family transcriptional regulator [Christensenellaceae bacterium OttesenSCG-928-K19]|nr:AraC family transcriptional regulator [Christensenellaceae bacterium OttesenSCG-928-K19]